MHALKVKNEIKIFKIIYKLKILKIMKKLEDFENEKVELSTINGGGCRISTWKNTKSGCYGDTFDDANGDGQWNGNEWGSIWQI